MSHGEEWGAGLENSKGKLPDTLVTVCQWTCKDKLISHL